MFCSSIFQDAPGWTPSARFLICHYESSRTTVLPGASHSQKEYDRLLMSRINGRVLKNDNNYFLPKFILGPLKCMNTLMNEFGQVVCRILLASSSLKPLARAFHLITQRSVYHNPEVSHSIVHVMGPGLTLPNVSSFNSSRRRECLFWMHPSDAQDVPTVIYCDNVYQQRKDFSVMFSPWLLTCIDDALHMGGRIARVIPDNHPLKGEICLLRSPWSRRATRGRVPSRDLQARQPTLREGPRKPRRRSQRGFPHLPHMALGEPPRAGPRPPQFFGCL